MSSLSYRGKSLSMLSQRSWTHRGLCAVMQTVSTLNASKCPVAQILRTLVRRKNDHDQVIALHRPKIDSELESRYSHFRNTHGKKTLLLSDSYLRIQKRARWSARYRRNLRLPHSVTIRLTSEPHWCAYEILRPALRCERGAPGVQVVIFPLSAFT